MLNLLLCLRRYQPENMVRIDSLLFSLFCVLIAVSICAETGVALCF